MKKAEPVVLAKVGRPYGIKGWTHVQSFSDPIEKVMTYDTLLCQQGQTWQPIAVEAWRLHNKGLVAKFSVVEDRTAAALLTGCLIGITPDALPALDENTFYWHELEGLSVHDEQAKRIGEVSHLYNLGASDVMVVSENQQDWHIPFVYGTVVKHVDLTNRKMVIDWEFNHNRPA